MKHHQTTCREQVHSSAYIFFFECPFVIFKNENHVRSISLIPIKVGGGAMVLGKVPVPGCPTIWITVGQGPTALVVGAGGGCLDIFTLIYPFLS